VWLVAPERFTSSKHGLQKEKDSRKEFSMVILMIEMPEMDMDNTLTTAIRNDRLRILRIFFIGPSFDPTSCLFGEWMFYLVIAAWWKQKMGRWFLGDVPHDAYYGPRDLRTQDIRLCMLCLLAAPPGFQPASNGHFFIPGSASDPTCICLSATNHFEVPIYH